MKSWILLCFAFFLSISTISFSQVSPFYVVIGVFEKEENAQHYLDNAYELNLPAVYAFSQEKKLYYVYVRMSGSKPAAISTLKRVREEGFGKAWIYQGALDNTAFFAKQKINVETEKATENVAAPENKVNDEVVTNSESTRPQGLSLVIRKDSSSLPVTPVGKPFLFKLINYENGNPVTGLIRLQESTNSDQYRGYNGNEKVYIAPPKNKSGRWFVVCHVVGFRPFMRQVNYGNPAQQKDVSLGIEQEAVIPLNLSRVRKGDYIEMDEVKFFENSSILEPLSERELSELVTMMQENPRYKVKIHGHTNGDQARDIISLGESQNLFALDQTNKKSPGSSKELSAQRAETVKLFLTGKGIDASRISTKGEGGKQMIFDPKGTLASANDRVEIEVTKH